MDDLAGISAAMAEGEWVDSTVQNAGPTSTPAAGSIESLIEAIKRRKGKPTDAPYSRNIPGSLNTGTIERAIAPYLISGKKQADSGRRRI